MAGTVCPPARHAAQWHDADAVQGQRPRVSGRCEMVGARGRNRTGTTEGRGIFMPLRLSPPAVPGTTVCGLEHAFTMAMAGPGRQGHNGLRTGWGGGRCWPGRPAGRATGARRLLSTPSRGRRCLFPGLARRWREGSAGQGPPVPSGRSPSLTGFIPQVSPRALKFSSPLCLPVSPLGQAQGAITPHNAGGLGGRCALPRQISSGPPRGANESMTRFMGW